MVRISRLPIESASEDAEDVIEDIEEPEEKTVSKRHVFLSYCHDDADAVRKLHDDLLAKGEPVWWNQDILPGQDWRQAIRRAMKDAYAVVVCLSQAITRREQSGVFPELREAIGELRLYPPGSIFIIPVRLDDCDVPDLEIDATTTLGGLQYVDLFPPPRRADSLERLVRALRAASGRAAEFRTVGAVEKEQEKTIHEGALKLWRQKLDFLLQEEAITASADMKFSLGKRIEEAKAKIRELGGDVTPAPATAAEPADDEAEHAAELVEIKRKRLRVLEKQAAFKGVDAPPHVVLEIDELKAEIDALLGRDS